MKNESDVFSEHMADSIATGGIFDMEDFNLNAEFNLINDFDLPTNFWSWMFLDVNFNVLSIYWSIWKLLIHMWCGIYSILTTVNNHDQHEWIRELFIWCSTYHMIFMPSECVSLSDCLSAYLWLSIWKFSPNTPFQTWNSRHVLFQINVFITKLCRYFSC